MQPQPQIIFEPFRLDVTNERLWHGEQLIPLMPKAFVLLKYLAERPGKLITKQELLNAVWPEAYVSDAVLKVCIGDLRKALGDDARRPRFIETAHRRGYRFIGNVVVDAPRRGSQIDAATAIVGRDEELDRLRGWFERARRGERKVVFVTGEPGIGKTSLVETFLGRVADAEGPWIARGQCLEQYGAGEAYLPVLEAVSRLSGEPGRERLISLLRRQAPMWLVQMPWLIMGNEREQLQRALIGATRERMLREMAEMLESLAADTLLIIVLEDLHWSDYSTLDLISLLARRRDPARLMIIGTYRPVEVSLSGHPLRAVKQELQMHRRCVELQLEFLSEEAVSEYLAARFPGSEIDPSLARVIQHRTGGNPLFMINVVDYLIGQGLIVEIEGRWRFEGDVGRLEVGVPDDVWQVIEKQVEQLSQDQQRVLEAASVTGTDFSATAAAAGLREDAGWVEERCEELARRQQFLKAAGTVELPDGRVTARFSFIHALYQNALYRRVGSARRASLHQQIGEHWEAAYGDRAGEIAAELAMHFERGRKIERAVKYLGQAADNAIRRFAYQEAVTLARRGLELLKTLPDTAERTRQELTLQMALCMALPVTEGYGAAILEKTFIYARELCQQMGKGLEHFRALRGLWTYYLFRAELRTARDISEQLIALAQTERDSTLMVAAHQTMGSILAHLGEFSKALDHCEQGLALYDPRQRPFHLSNYKYDPGSALRCISGWSQWVLGYPDQSLNNIREGLALAKDVGHPENLALATFYTAFFYQLRHEPQSTIEHAEDLISLAGEHGFVTFIAIGTSLRGWALAEMGRRGEGIEQICQTLADHAKVGSEIARLHFRALLAEALMKDRQIEEGLGVLCDAMEAVRRKGYYYEAELYRLRGELLLQRPGAGSRESEVMMVSDFWDMASSPEECFQQAIEVARRQGAKSFELRAVMSMSRLWRRQGKRAEAREMLAAVYGWFTEGFDSPDLIEARALLAELA